MQSTVNMVLAKEKGLTSYEIYLIEKLHSLFDELWKNHQHFTKEELLEISHTLEYHMQTLWGFPQDKLYHYRTRDFYHTTQWAGTKITCNETGEVVILPEFVQEKQFFGVGKGFLDTGTNGYFRKGGDITIEKAN